MDIFKIDGYEFIKFNDGNAVFVFSTAKGELDFNKATVKGRENINSLKQWFGLEEVGFLDQIHSDLVYEYDGIVHKGDALITDRTGFAMGVFTADCVPILIYDKKRELIAAVHSGWKGTLSNIAGKTIDKMKALYGSESEDFVVYIGPHNKSCCYEVGEEVAVEFINEPEYKGINIFSDGKLNLEACITVQLINKGVKRCYIHSLGICTYCSENYELHSYRKLRENSGRMFSFIYLLK